jgi:hypothetical protein
MSYIKEQKFFGAIWWSSYQNGYWVGKIATMLPAGGNRTPAPLQKRMDQLSNVLVSGSMTFGPVIIVFWDDLLLDHHRKN